jgi:hypothetical protein
MQTTVMAMIKRAIGITQSQQCFLAHIGAVYSGGNFFKS